ncbi:hypothetical protein LCGC14_3139270 [marine sediment metagenome]|uniref:Uncharacterized protein n=1 Tax=marine sediment metagenome TaxID=412755 RepID=A0A0F8Y4C0_9ZZZZ
MLETKLGHYEGHDILGATVSIRNTGDGLSQAMTIDPVKLSLYGTVRVVLEAEVEKHRYEEIKDSAGAVTLVNMLKATSATIVGGELDQTVSAVLNDQAEKIAAANADDPTLLDEE